MCMLKPLLTNLYTLNIVSKAELEKCKTDVLKILQENDLDEAFPIVEALFDKQLMIKELEDILPDCIGV